MMIADLFDEHDFKEKLLDLGIPLADDETLDVSLGTVLTWLESTPETVPQLIGLFETLRHSELVLLPEIDNFIDNVQSVCKS